MGMLLRHVRIRGWNRKGRPSVAAVTVPGCYDQLRRRAVLQASQMAGFSSVRLIDRCLAAGQSQLHVGLAAEPIPAPSDLQHWLVFGVNGLGCEASVLRHVAGRLETIATAGQWNVGTLTWQRRLLELVAERCQRELGIDPRKRLRDASRLQQACEKAMKDLLLRERVEMRFRAGGRNLTLEIGRSMLTAAGDEVVQAMLHSISRVLVQSQIRPDDLQRVLTIGSMARLRQVRGAVAELFGWELEHPEVEFTPIDRRVIAQGAALAAAGELPGRDGIAMPPQGATTYDLGLLGYQGGDPKTATFPVIPAGTALPARTGRRLTLPRGAQRPASITIVESSGKSDVPWRSLGTHRLPDDAQQTPWEVIFEVDINGLLSLRLRNMAGGESERLATVPPPTLRADELRQWSNWLEETALLQ